MRHHFELTAKRAIDRCEGEARHRRRFANGARLPRGRRLKHFMQLRVRHHQTIHAWRERVR